MISVSGATAVTGIIDIGSYIPQARVDNMAHAERFAFNEAFIRTKIGFTSTARKAPDEDTSDLAVKAVRALQAKSGFDPAQAQCLVVVTQNPDGHGLPHTSAIVHHKLGLPTGCFAFDVSLGCSGYVAGLAVIKGFMATAGLTHGILVTADPYSKVIDEDDRNTFLIFGDAATATLLGPDPAWQIGPFDMGTDGKTWGALEVKPNGKLFMNGRAVFDFCATNVPGSIRRVLDAGGCAPGEVDHYLFHQGSKYIVDTVAGRLNIGPVAFGAAEYGNTVSSSIPLLLEPIDPTQARTVCLSGFGVGLGWASTLLRSRRHG